MLAAGAPPVRELSNINGNTYFPSDKRLTLLEQTQTSLSGGWRDTTNLPIDWFSPETYVGIKEDALTSGNTEEEYTGGLHVGWYFDLPTPRERVITTTQIRDGKAIIVSITPSDAACSAGGSSVVHVVNACNGGMLDAAQFDSNGDGEVGNEDDPHTGKEYSDDLYYSPAILEDKMYFSKDLVEDTTSETRGLHYWRMFDSN